MNQQELIQGCISRNQSAQKLLVDCYSPMLYKVCLRYASDKDFAKDCLQETLVQILFNLDKYKEQGSFEGWMATVAVRKCLDMISKRKKYNFSDLLEIDRQVEEVSSTKLEVEDIHDYLAQIPEQYRIVINMYLVEGYDHKEIAKALGIKEGSSRTLLTRAKKMIRKAFSDDELKIVSLDMRDRKIINQ